MKPKQLEAIGRRLFGENWQSPLARALKKHRITVWRWLKGAPIPEDLAKKITMMDARYRLERFKFDTSGYIYLTPISKLREMYKSPWATHQKASKPRKKT